MSQVSVDDFGVPVLAAEDIELKAVEVSGEGMPGEIRSIQRTIVYPERSEDTL